MPFEFAEGSLIRAASFMRMLTAAKFLPTRQKHADPAFSFADNSTIPDK
jgi:hypothetical protein